MDLELRRLGGDRGLLGLLRPPSKSDSNDAFAARVELGAALVACRIAENASIRSSSSGRSRSSSSRGSNLRLFPVSSSEDRFTRGDGGDETSSCLLCTDGGGSATTAAAAAASSNGDGVVTGRSWETKTLTAIVDALLLLNGA